MSPRKLPYCGVLALPVFLGTALTLGFNRAGYDPFRFPVSSLAIGPEGWTQQLNFLVTGTMILVAALAVLASRPTDMRTPFRLFAASGIGLIGAGLFRTDPLFGFPADQSMRIRSFTLSGHLHDLFSAVFFFSVPVACIILCRRDTGRGQRLFPAAALTILALSFAGSTAGFRQLAFVSVAGLLQRVAIAANLVVIAVYCWREVRRHFR